MSMKFCVICVCLWNVVIIILDYWFVGINDFINICDRNFIV